MVWTSNRSLDDVTLADFRGHPRASSWIARHNDIRRIVNYMKLVRNPKVLDGGCGNGFISMLLAREGVDVLGIDIGMQEEVQDMYPGVDNLRLEDGDVSDGEWYKERNIVFNSWMPLGFDLSGYFKYTKPTPDMIIYVKGRATGMQPGMSNNPNDIDSYTLPFGFVEADRWKTFGNDDFLEEESVKLGEPSCEVLIQTPEEFYRSKEARFKADKLEDVVPYNWEKEMPSVE